MNDGSAELERSQRAARAPRIDALTGLRIIPALAVLLSHLPPSPWSEPHLQAFFSSGYMGVTVFFVLSGFVLTHNYFGRIARDLSPRLLVSYVVARLARVYPLYLLILVWVSFRELWTGTVDKQLWLDHALALQAWSGALDRVYSFNAPGWSISVEFFLYACFPLLALTLEPVLRKRRGVLIALLLVVLSMVASTSYFYWTGYANLPPDAPASAHRWLYRNPLGRLGDFMLGMVAARLLACGHGIPLNLLRWGAAISTAVIVALMSWPEHVFSAASWDLSYALPATVLIFCLAATPTSPGSRWLSTKPLVLLGEASYALYLCHMTMLGRMSFGKLPTDAWLVSNAFALLLVVAFAIGLHVAVERPARELLRALLDPLARRRAAVVTSEDRAET